MNDLIMHRVNVYSWNTRNDDVRVPWMVGIVLSEPNDSGDVQLVVEKHIDQQGVLQKQTHYRVREVPVRDCESIDKLMEEEALTHPSNDVRDIYVANRETNSP